MKKIFCVVLALVMVMGLATTAFAAADEGTEGNTITIENAVKGITYDLYKMFDLTVDDASNPTAFSYTVNEDWKAFFTGTGAGAAYITIDDKGYVTDVDEENIAELAAAAEEYAKDLEVVASKTATADGALVFDGLASGYYLITSTLGTKAAIDTTPTKPNAVVKEKNTQPPIKKEVEEDSLVESGAEDTTGKENDAEIGQKVRFETTISVYPGAENYVVHDAMCDALDFTGADEVSIAGLTKGTDYTVVTENLPADCGGKNGPCDFHIVFSQDYLDTVTVKTDLVIEYFAIVNESAEVATAMPNDTKLTFGEDHSTEWDRTNTYTWSIGILKYGNGKEENVLAGAKFVLLNVAKTHVAQFNSDGELIKWVEIVSGENATNLEDYALTTDKDGKIAIKGLDSDKYYLREIEAPAGYNKLDEDIEVNVVKGDVGNDGIVVEYTPTEAKVNNQAGTELPSTGGIGTTIFYVLGAALAICAVVVLVTRRRMTSEG